MKTDDVKILNTRIRMINLNIARNLANNLKLDAEWNMEARISKDKDKDILFLVNLKVFDEKHENFMVELNGEIIFEFSEKPDDLNKISEERCMPLAQIELSEILDNILNNAGYAKLDLAHKMNLK